MEWNFGYTAVIFALLAIIILGFFSWKRKMCYNQSSGTIAVTLTCNICTEFHQTSLSVLLDLQVLYGYFMTCLQEILPESHEYEYVCILAGEYLLGS